MRGSGVSRDTTQSSGVVPRKPRILVVDDDRDMLNLLALFLDLAGFAVTIAADGTEALRLAPNGFDAITTDLSMPRMGGVEFIQRLRELPIAPVPVVVMTAQALDPALTERFRSCRVLTKPCDLDELARHLRTLLATCRHDHGCCSTCPCQIAAA
jgi:CheY-like chemotaxis protein